MSEEFLKWFDSCVPFSMWGDKQDERENLKVYCWLAWRDSRRAPDIAKALGQ